jgi:nitroreductase
MTAAGTSPPAAGASGGAAGASGGAADVDLAAVDHLLTSTRSVRKRLDFARPVPREVISECLEIALQAPTGSNAQRWRWIVVSDEGRRRALGEIYQRAFREYLKMGAGGAAPGGIHSGDDEGARKLSEYLVAQEKMMRSVTYLIDHVHEAPIHVVPCVVGRIQPDASSSWISSHFGSVYPAVWSLQLALRSRGLGTCITTAHLGYEAEAADVLGIPFELLTQVCLLPVAYYTGTGFRPAKRRPSEEVVFWEQFDPDSLAEGQY